MDTDLALSNMVLASKPYLMDPAAIDGALLEESDDMLLNGS